jgi:hypothetical protein
LPQLDISQSHILEDLDLPQYRGHRVKELHGLVDGHVEHVGNRFALELHFQRLAVVAFAAAFLTGDGCKILYGARSSSGDIIAALARTETSKGETALNDFLADPASAELEKIICITAHDIPETERVSIVKVSPRKGTP